MNISCQENAFEDVLCKTSAFLFGPQSVKEAVNER